MRLSARRGAFIAGRPNIDAMAAAIRGEPRTPEEAMTNCAELILAHRRRAIIAGRH